MPDNYFEIKTKDDKYARKGIWIVVLLLIALIVVTVRFARSASSPISIFIGLPSSSEAYDVSKKFITPDIKGVNIKFADAYQFGKRTDSVYIIRSFIQNVYDNRPGKLYFKVVLKYKGGQPTQKDNWEVLDVRFNN
ncbi:MAG: hypothetical protein EOP47_22045 [Sphingobacteriaceae bacterium]|nr:MAG: hypothetical protein EOP47_22045 [Sphingobacteriaceae bacterium]